MWLNSNDFSNNYKQFLPAQDFTNFSSARGCGCQSSKIHIAGQFSSWSATFLLALFECPHLHNLHWKAPFLYLSAFPFFLRRIPNSSTCSTTQKKIINSTQSTSKRYFSGSSSKVDEFEIRRRKEGNAEKYKKRTFQCKLICKWGLQIKRATK